MNLGQTGQVGKSPPDGTPRALLTPEMPGDHSTPLEVFVPALVWAGRRPSLRALGTWHEALRDAVGQVLPVDLLAYWVLPSRGGWLLVGPSELAGSQLPIPTAEPLVTQEALFALEDHVQAAGYRSAMAVPIRAEVQDVGLLLAASFAEDSYSRAELRQLHRIAAMLSTTSRRLAALPWIRPAAVVQEPVAATAGITEAILDALDGARGGDDLVQLVSDAIGALLPHDRLELIAVAPAPDCWAMIRSDVSRGGINLPPADLDRIDAFVHEIGHRQTARIEDIADHRLEWPGHDSVRGPSRQRSLLAARLEVGGELVGWLWLGHEGAGWFREEDEATSRLVARLLASRVATWIARKELAGAW